MQSTRNSCFCSTDIRETCRKKQKVWLIRAIKVALLEKETGQLTSTSYRRTGSTAATLMQKWRADIELALAYAQADAMLLLATMPASKDLRILLRFSKSNVASSAVRLQAFVMAAGAAGKSERPGNCALGLS